MFSSWPSSAWEPSVPSKAPTTLAPRSAAIQQVIQAGTRLDERQVFALLRSSFNALCLKQGAGE